MGAGTGTGESGEPFYVKYTLYLSTLYHQIDLLDEIIQSGIYFITMLYVARLFSLCASFWTKDSCSYCLVLFIVIVDSMRDNIFVSRAGYSSAEKNAEVGISP